jgi:opacity protein-like surface antigen
MHMKKRHIVFLSLIVLISLSASATANAATRGEETVGVYFAATGGLAVPSNMSLNITEATPTGGVINQDVSMKAGWLLGAKVGWQTFFTKRWLAMEVEYNHIESNIDTDKYYQTAGSSLTWDATAKMDAFMFNLIGRYPEGRFHPYIGGGAGIANAQLTDIKSSVDGANYLYTDKGNKWVFAYQIVAGIDFDITKNFFIGLGYKYFAANKAQFDTTVISPLAAGVAYPGTVEMGFRSHNFIMTVGFLF